MRNARSRHAHKRVAGFRIGAVARLSDDARIHPAADRDQHPSRAEQHHEIEPETQYAFAAGEHPPARADRRLPAGTTDGPRPRG